MQLQGFIRASLVATLFLPSAAWAMHPLVTDDAGTQGQGKYQLEVNGQYDHDDEGAVSTRGGQNLNIFSYGVLDTVDLVTTVPYQWNKEEDSGVTTKDESGLGDTSLEVKWRFFEREGLSLAVKPGINLPTGDEDKGFGAGKVGYHVYAIASKEADPWAFHANLGYIRSDNDINSREDLWHASLAAVYSVIQDLKLVGNIGVDRNPDPTSDDNPAYLIGGLVYSVSKSFDIDCGYRHALTSTGPDWSLLAGTTFHF